MGTALLPLILLLLNQMLFSTRSWAEASNEEEEEAAAVCAGTACYTAHWDKLSASEAQLSCSTNGGNLATVKNEEEAQHIQEALAQLPDREAPGRTVKFWIGLQREKGKCMNPDEALKGFSWVGGAENTSYSNWQKEPMSTCISKRCASLSVDLSASSLAAAHSVPKWTESPCGTTDSPGRNIEGYVCKFSFKGMCHPVALGGPGEVTYTTPFGATSTSLAAVPFASAASVNCGYGDERKSHYLVCKERNPNQFDWGTSGPICASPNHGCAFNNGGCQQECLEGGDGSFLCGCRPGYRLLDDLVSCVPRDPCHPNPCRGKAKCSPGGHGKHYECLCPAGFKPTPNRLDCDDVDECDRIPCAQDCVNTPGSFHCTCRPGYEPQGHNGMECWDVDECAEGRSPCAQLCNNTEGSFQCTCHKGYVATGEDGTQCQDVNECDDEGNPCESLCFNIQGSFRCGCLPGWNLAPNGVSCIANHTMSVLPSDDQEKDEKERKIISDVEKKKGEKEKEKENSDSSSPVLDTIKRLEVTPGVSIPYNEASTVGRLSQQSNPPITQSLPRPPTFSRKPKLQLISSTVYPTEITTDGGLHKGKSLANGSDGDTDGQKFLLFYILGAVAAVLLLLAMALGLVFYRKKKTKKAMKKKSPKNAADSYSWVPEQVENRAIENEYR